MRGLDPRIHQASEILSKKMDCRVEPGNDGMDCFASLAMTLY
jgi:hypothetical protein